MKHLTALIFAFLLSLSGYALANHDGTGDHCMRHDKASSTLPADTDNDGTVDWEEAHNAFIKHFDEMDANHDGVLSAEEMKNCCCMQGKHCKDGDKCKRDGKCKHNESAHNKGSKQFDAADKDHDGTLDKKEAKKLPRVYKNFDAIDVDQDGTVDRDEVHDYMSNHPQ